MQWKFINNNAIDPTRLIGITTEMGMEENGGVSYELSVLLDNGLSIKTATVSFNPLDADDPIAHEEAELNRQIMLLMSIADLARQLGHEVDQDVIMGLMDIADHEFDPDGDL